MKLKKLAAIFMTAVMTTAMLTACGSDDDNEKQEQTGSFKTSIEEGMNIGSCTYEGKISFSVEGESFSGQLDDDLKSILGIEDNALELAITLKGNADKENGNGDTTMGISINDAVNTDIFELILVDDTAYIGVETLVQGVADMAEQLTGEDVSQMFESSLPEGAYLKVTKDMLQDILNLTETEINGNTSLDLFEYNISSEEQEKAEELIEYFADILDKGIKKGAKSAYSNDGDTYKLTINNDNINGIVEGLADVVAARSDDISKKLSDILGTEVVDGDTLKSSAGLLKSYDVNSMLGDVDFEIVITTMYKDDVWELGFTASVKEGTDQVGVGFEYKAVKADDLDIKAPTDLISEEDTEAIMNMITQNIEALEEGNTDYDSIYDDYDDSLYDDADDYDDSLYDDVYSDNTSDEYTYSSIDEYVSSEEFQSAIESLMSSLESQGMKMDITGEDNKLIYTYTYTTITVDDDTRETMVESLESGLASQSSQFTSLAASLSDIVDVKDPVVQIKYIDAEGTLIYEAEFTAE